MFRLSSLFVIVLSLLATNITCLPHQKRSVPTKSGYTVTFADDFTGTTLSSNWKRDAGTQYSGGPAQWGTGEVETYTTSTRNAAVANGVLSITPSYVNGQWQSSRIETVQSDFMAKPGKKLVIEASIYLGSNPASKQLGIWPAFWALGASFRSDPQSWPAASEWDIMENVNGGNSVYQGMHCGVNPGGPCNEPNGRAVSKPVSRGQYHTYTFVVDRTASFWRSETVSWYIDGFQTQSIRGGTINDTNVWTNIAHKPFFLLLDVAVGGGFPSAFSGGQSTPSSSTVGGSGSGMKVDYVAVYNSV